MFVPPFLMLSDMRYLPNWRSLLAQQPRSVGLVLRDYEHDARAELAAEMADFCARQGRYFAIAGNARLAARLNTAFHCPSYMIARPALRLGRVGPHDTAAVHNMAELLSAARAGFSHVFISPVFATASHEGARPLSVLRAMPLLRAARQKGLCAYALGGMNMTQWRRLGGFDAADGFAAVGAFQNTSPKS
jgi:thiamine-phosphate pyrophosphorylase